MAASGTLTERRGVPLDPAFTQTEFKSSMGHVRTAAEWEAASDIVRRTIWCARRMPRDPHRLCRSTRVRRRAPY